MRVEHNNGVALIITISEVPFFNQLSGYQWVGDFVKSLKIQDKQDELIEERKQINALPVSKVEFLARCKTSYAALQQRAVAKLQHYLGNETLRHSSVTDPFSHFENRFLTGFHPETPFVPLWADVLAAIKTLPDDGVDTLQREKMLKRIDSQILTLTADLRAVSPDNYVTWRGDLILSDMRKSFYEHWLDLQSQLSAPSGPRAISLDASSDAEKNAWEKLGLAEFINPRGIKPNPND